VHACPVCFDARDAARAIELAARPGGIPPVGALALLRTDPLTQGPRLFASNCSSCRYEGHDGLGNLPADEQSAPDLFGYAGRAWVEGFEKIMKAISAEAALPRQAAMDAEDITEAYSLMAEPTFDRRDCHSLAILVT
jgi:hypothetical protein